MDVKNFTKFTGKHLCQSLFLNKVAEKETLTQVFPCEFYKIFKNISLYSKPPVATSSISWLHIQNLHYVKIYFSKILIKSSILKANFFFNFSFICITKSICHQIMLLSMWLENFRKFLELRPFVFHFKKSFALA